MPVLILLRGAPDSGKSTAERLDDTEFGSWRVYHQGGVYHAYYFRDFGWRCFRTNMFDKPPHPAEHKWFSSIAKLREAVGNASIPLFTP